MLLLVTELALLLAPFGLTKSLNEQTKKRLLMLKSMAFITLLLLSLGLFVSESVRPNVEVKAMAKSNWSEQELANVHTVADFVQNLMNEHNFEYVLARYNDSAYVQHNRNIPDKVTGLVNFLADFVEDYPEYSYQVKHIYADGDIVIFHSHATLYKEDRGNDKKGLNIIDSWRLDNGKIVEHWDSIQALDGFMRFYSLISGGDIRNTNGVF